MIDRQREQFKALKEEIVDKDLARSDWDVTFINNLHAICQRTRRPQKSLTNGQIAQLRRLLIDYTPELTAVGKRDLTFTNAPKAKETKL